MSLGYLVSPALQIEDVNGKPLTGGTLEVKVGGTSTTYITYRDFMGNRNPASVELDAMGMAILIADDSQAYDVYCYNKNGALQWSRLNVKVGGGSGGGGGGTEYVAGDGINISGETISVDTSVIQPKLTAGDNVSIVGNVISATDTDTTYTATAPIAIDLDNDISINLGSGLTTDNGDLVIDTSVVRSVPDSDGTNEGQVLGVTNSSGDIGWVTVSPSGTVDQTYDPTSSNAQSGTAVAQAISGVNEVPSASSGDNGKVLGVTDSQGNIGWVTAGGTQLQSNWTESDNQSVQYIQNKPAEKALVAGSNITITEGTNDITIASVAELPTITGNAGKVLTVNSGATGVEWGNANGMFIAVYGNSTWAQVDAAFQAGKLLYCQYGSSGPIAQLTYATSTQYIFMYYVNHSVHGGTYQDEVYLYTLDSSTGWSYAHNSTGSQLVAGDGIRLTFNNSNDQLTISARGYTTWETDWTSGYTHSHDVTQADVNAGYFDMYHSFAAGADTTSIITDPIRVNLTWDTWCLSGAASGYVSSIDFAIGVAGGSYKDMFSDNSPAHEVHKDWFIYPNYLLHYRCNSIRIRYNLTSNATVGTSFQNEVSGLVDQVR